MGRPHEGHLNLPRLKRGVHEYKIKRVIGAFEVILNPIMLYFNPVVGAEQLAGFVKLADGVFIAFHQHGFAGAS